MRERVFGLGALALAAAALVGCSPSGADQGNPELAQRGATMTTAKPARQDLANTVSLSGKVTMNPVFGLVAPVRGQVRFLDVKPPVNTPTKPTRVASVWAGGKAHTVQVPAGATFLGRLVDDRSTVAAGMPVVSAKLVGYGVVADIDSAEAYRVSDSLGTVRAQIKNGPGPFTCSVLGTIAALPAGTVPEEPAPPAAPEPEPAAPQPAPPGAPEQRKTPSEPTGMRLVCTAPSDVRLINGAAATLEVVTQQAKNALVVPVEAVAGSQGKGKVDVVGADRTRQTRDVVLGLTDGKVIEIKSGLTEQETVAVPGPAIPTSKTNGGPNGGHG